MLHYRPRLVERVPAAATSGALTERLFEKGMISNLAGWLSVTALHRFARDGDVESAVVFRITASTWTRAWRSSAPRLWVTQPPPGSAAVEFLLERGAKVTLLDDLACATPIALTTYRGH